MQVAKMYQKMTIWQLHITKGTIYTVSTVSSYIDNYKVCAECLKFFGILFTWDGCYGLTRILQVWNRIDHLATVGRNLGRLPKGVFFSSVSAVEGLHKGQPHNYRALDNMSSFCDKGVFKFNWRCNLTLKFVLI